MFYQEIQQLRTVLYEHRRYQEQYGDPFAHKDVNKLGSEALDKIDEFLKPLPQTPIPFPPKESGDIK